MMKMVPASRLVTDASLDPPSSKRSRRIGPACDAVAGCASITIRKEFRKPLRIAATVPAYQLFVKIELGVAPVPALPAQSARA